MAFDEEILHNISLHNPESRSCVFVGKLAVFYSGFNHSY